MANLFDVVSLYRVCNKPLFDGSSFQCSTPLTSEILSLVRKIMSDNFSAGHFQEIEVDELSIDEVDELPAQGSFISFSFLVSQSSAERFYKNYDDFIIINTIAKGILPKEYYIANDDYFSTEENKPIEIIKIEKIANLINSLAFLAHYHDIKNEGVSSYYRLVFVLHSESKSSSVVIETSLTNDVIEYDILDDTLVNSLTKISPLTDLHYDEKINTFRNTLIEYLKLHKSTFTELVKNWDRVCELYQNNFSVYMSAFSFHKVRKEVADAEIEYAEKISKTLVELSNKVLAIPISFVATIAMMKLTDKIEVTVSFIGVFLTALIMHLVIKSQEKQFERIKSAKNLIFISLENKVSDENSELKSNIVEAITELNKNERFCSKVLILLLSLAWTPLSISTLILIYKNI
ncbi:hypothetical protein [Dickeya zeae]|uniref:hypothetical protein n=1 Tax=Dickeya zeae TaxID=204042 RepID=UPI001F200B27|nr:hypothetical protein [Dickeya zeae]UJR62106.1 hypothetical protein HJ586_07715 [Dickeya zeae]